MEFEVSMSNTVAAPPIFTLYDDLLLHVFHLNTHRPQTEYPIIDDPVTRSIHWPIDTARFTSQVCRSWRHVLLDSPTIWASIIDLRIANTRSEKWIEEVMRRTDGAYLSIHGSVGSHRSASFLKSLLVNHWHRVRTLDVNLYHVPPSFMDIEDTLDILWTQKAPNLEKFLLTGEISRHELSDLRKGPMFSDSAPSLRRYHCTILSPNPKATWLSQLCSVTLSGPILTTTDVLNIISHTVRLESLVVQHATFDSEAMNWTRKIHLPKIIRIHIRGTIPETLVYLGNIVRNPQCALRLDTNDVYDQVSGMQLTTYIATVVPCAGSYLDFYRPHAMRLCVKSKFLDFLCEPKPVAMAYFGQPTLKLFSRFTEQPHHPLTIPFFPFFSALSSVPLNHITTLEFDMGDENPCIKIDDDPDFFKLIMSFSSVETLKTPIGTLEILNDILAQRGCSRAFPCLKHLELMGYYESSALPKVISRFLSLRKTARIPVPRLTVPHFGMFAGRGTWRFLEQYVGLILCWEDDFDNGSPIEYKCGTGIL